MLADKNITIQSNKCYQQQLICKLNSMEDEYKEKFMVAETTKAGLDGKKNCISFGEPYVNVNIFGHHCYLAISSYEKPDFPL